MSQAVIENWLRPPVEAVSAVALAGLSVMLAFAPQWLLLPKPYLLLLALSAMLLGLWRFSQALQVKRYQRSLRRLPYYSLSSDELQTSTKKLFLGKGFRWETKHTQRLYDASRSEAKRYNQPTAIYRLARQFEARHPQHPLAQLTKSLSWWNPVKPLPDLGGSALLHGVEPNEKNVCMNISERVGHTLVLGTTRVGKTRLLELLAAQDIQRGEVVIVFDPKGDADLLRRMVYEAEVAGRADDMVVFHLGFPKVSARYNPIGNFARITEVANRIANQLPGSGESAAFKEFAWRFTNIIAKALVALGRRPDYKQIQRYILVIDPLLDDYSQRVLTKTDPTWRKKVDELAQKIKVDTLPRHLLDRPKHLIALVQYIKAARIGDPILEGLCSIFNYDKTYFDKITASLLPLIDKLTSGKIADLISPDYEDIDDSRLVFDWMQVIRGRKIVYVGLDALSDPIVASSVGNSMFADLCSVAGQLYKYGVSGELTGDKTQQKISVHSDEFNELIGDEFIPLLNKAGGAGIQVTAYTQTWSDVEARLGNKAKAGQVGGNLNTLICLRVLEEDTAKLLTNKLPQRVSIKTLLPSSSVNDSVELGAEQDFSSHNEDRIASQEVPLLSANNLLQLPKGQAFALLEGGQLWKLRMPLPKDDMQHLPSDVEPLVTYLSKVRAA